MNPFTPWSQRLAKLKREDEKVKVRRYRLARRAAKSRPFSTLDRVRHTAPIRQSDVLAVPGGGVGPLKPARFHEVRSFASIKPLADTKASSLHSRSALHQLLNERAGHVGGYPRVTVHQRAFVEEVPGSLQGGE